MKGSEVVKKSAELFRDSHLNFHGNVEGDDIFKGTTDVVVCDGFTGNISLKTTEGLAKMMANFLTLEFKRNWLTKISAIIAMPVLRRFKKRLDPRRYNGASFLGLNGIFFLSLILSLLNLVPLESPVLNLLFFVLIPLISFFCLSVSVGRIFKAILLILFSLSLIRFF